VAVTVGADGPGGQRRVHAEPVTRSDSESLSRRLQCEPSQHTAERAGWGREALRGLAEEDSDTGDSLSSFGPTSGRRHGRVPAFRVLQVRGTRHSTGERLHCRV
jgi:hypothetical protein